MTLEPPNFNMLLSSAGQAPFLHQVYAYAPSSARAGAEGQTRSMPSSSVELNWQSSTLHQDLYDVQNLERAIITHQVPLHLYKPTRFDKHIPHTYFYSVFRVQ